MAKKWAFFGVVAVCFVGVEHGVTHRVCCAFYFKFFCMTNSAALVLKLSRRNHEKFSDLKRGWHFSRERD